MYKLSSWKWTKAKSPVHASSIQTTFICLWCLIPIPKNWIVPNSNVSFWIVPNSIALNWIVPNSNVTKWIVPYSNTIKLNCALFQWSQIELCLIPISSNLIVSTSKDLDSKFQLYFWILSILPIFSYLDHGFGHKFNFGSIGMRLVQIPHFFIVSYWPTSQ